MEPAIAATLIGVLGTGLIGVLAGAFHLLRSDLKELRAENRADHRETNRRIEGLEGKLDGLIRTMARTGFLVDPQPPQPPTDPQG